MMVKELLVGEWKMLRIYDEDKNKEFEIYADKNIKTRGFIYHMIYDNSFKSYNKKVDLERELTHKKLRLLETKYK